MASRFSRQFAASSKRAPAEDRSSRAVVVTLTPAGHALVERLVDRVLGREADLVACLSDADRAALTGQLKALLDDLSARLGPQRHSQVGTL